MVRRGGRRVPASAPRSAVVTGGARGIGRAVAEALVERGYAVVVADRDGEQARATANDVGAVAGVVQDVTDEGSHREVATLARGHAPLGVWVSNAGVGLEGAATEQESGAVRTLVEVNLLGALWGARAAAEAYREQAADGIRGGDVAFTASLSALGPVPGLSVYAATKAAVLSLTTSLAAELRPERIRVHAICPDGVRTDLLDSMADDSRAKALVRSGVLYEPAEVADALVDMLGTSRVYRTMPRWRGLVMRAGALAPSVLIRVEPMIRRLGARRVRRET